MANYILITRGGTIHRTILNIVFHQHVLTHLFLIFMKKIFTLYFLTAILFCGAIFAINGLAKQGSFLDCNVEALTQTETNQNSPQANCEANGDYWNMALSCVTGGVIPVTCTISGQLTVLGVTLQGSYTTGCQYYIAWEVYSCVVSTEKCCDRSEQGTHVHA